MKANWELNVAALYERRHSAALARRADQSRRSQTKAEASERRLAASPPASQRERPRHPTSLRHVPVYSTYNTYNHFNDFNSFSLPWTADCGLSRRAAAWEGWDERDEDEEDQLPARCDRSAGGMTARNRIRDNYYGAEAACSCAVKLFVPLFTQSTVPLAVGFGVAGKLSQPITISLPLLRER